MVLTCAFVRLGFDAEFVSHRFGCFARKAKITKAIVGIVCGLLHSTGCEDLSLLRVIGKLSDS